MNITLTGVPLAAGALALMRAQCCSASIYGSDVVARDDSGSTVVFSALPDVARSMFAELTGVVLDRSAPMCRFAEVLK